VAYLTASREVLLNVFNDPDAFISDAAFLFLFASLIVFIFGPGAFSVDGIIKKFFRRSRHPKPELIVATSPFPHGVRRSLR
jgi:putative oxidoreductase